MIVFVGNSHLDQFKLGTYNHIQFIQTPGTSIKGLVNPNSSLKVAEKIKHVLEINKNENITLVFFLGQVDIEFGYYYKCVKDNIKYDINIYIDDLINKYKSYLKTLPCKFVILAINPTIIKYPETIFRICFREDWGIPGFYSETNHSICFDNIKYTFLNDSYETRFGYTQLFNEKLKQMCIMNGYTFLSFWDHIVQDGRVNPIYLPRDGDDHHLVVAADNTIFTDFILKNLN